MAELEKLFVEKTARVQPSSTSPAAVWHWSAPRISTVGIAYSPAAETSWSAVTHVRSFGRRSSWNKGEATGLLQTDAPEQSPGFSVAAARKSETRSSNRGRKNDGRLCEGDLPEPRRGEDRGTPRSARKMEPGSDPSSSDHSEDSSGESVVKRNSTRKSGRHSMGVKLGNYNGSTCLQTFLARFENYLECIGWDELDKLLQLRASLVGAAGQILWNAGNSRRWVELSPC